MATADYPTTIPEMDSINSNNTMLPHLHKNEKEIAAAAAVNQNGTSVKENDKGRGIEKEKQTQIQSTAEPAVTKVNDQNAINTNANANVTATITAATATAPTNNNYYNSNLDNDRGSASYRKHGYSNSSTSSGGSAISDKGLFTHTIDPDVRAMLEGIIDPVVVANGVGFILYVNSAACSMFGYEKTEIIHQNVGILMPKPFRDHHDGYLKKYADGAPPKLLGITRRLKGQTKQGQIFNVDISLGEFPFALAERGKLYVATFREVKTTSAEKRVNDESSFSFLADLLERNDLAQYIPIFEQEDIDLETFFHLNDELLQQLGIKKLGPRLKLLALIESSNTETSHSVDSSGPSIGADFGPHIPISDIKFIESIGRGSFGVVYRGIWNGKEVAIKKLMHSCVAEAKLLSEIRHRNIVTCYGACLEPPDFCLIMELGVCNLKEAIRTRDMTASVILDWTKQIATGMNYLHVEAPQKIIHRDLKPGNVLLFAGGVLKITDFGLSRVRDDDATEKMSSVGTFEYMAPEVIKNQPYSEKCDVWSFGVLLWELLTRQVPYKGVPSLAVAFGVGAGTLKLPIPSECPPLFKTLLTTCFARDYNDRLSFKEILRIYDLIAQSEFVEVSFKELLMMQNSWQNELESSYADFRKQMEHLNQRQALLELAELQLSQREAEIGRRETAIRQSYAADLICSVTGKSHADDCLGFGVHVSYLEGRIKYIAVDFRLINEASFSTERLFDYMGKTINTTHWIPLFLPDNSKKSETTNMLVNSSLTALIREKNGQLPSEAPPPSLPLEDVYSTISYLMFGVMETYVDIVEDTTLEPTKLSVVIYNMIQSFLSFHRMFLYYVFSHPGSDVKLSKKIDEFVTNIGSRSTSEIPNIGKFFITFSLTNYSENKFYRVFLREFLQRTWPAIIKEDPSLASILENKQNEAEAKVLLEKLFRICRKGIRTVIFCVFFYRTFVQTYSSSYEPHRYDPMVGRSNIAQGEDVEQATHNILNMNSFNEFFDWMGATYLCGNEMEVLTELKAQYDTARRQSYEWSPFEMTICNGQREP